MGAVFALAVTLPYFMLWGLGGGLGAAGVHYGSTMPVVAESVSQERVAELSVRLEMRKSRTGILLPTGILFGSGGAVGRGCCGGDGGCEGVTVPAELVLTK